MKKVISLVIAIAVMVSMFVIPASAEVKTWAHCLDAINDAQTGTTPSTEVTEVSSEAVAGTDAKFTLQGWVALDVGVTSFAISKDSGTTWEAAQFELFDRSGEGVQGFRVVVSTAGQAAGAHSALIAAVIDGVNYDMINFTYTLTDPNVLSSASQIVAGETKLTQDITGLLSVTEGTYVIDLAGFTWSHNNVALQVEGTADVTIIDSVGGGKISVDPNDAINAYGGSLTLNGVTVESDGPGMDGIFVKAGNIVVKNSTIIAPKAGIDASQSETEATILVDGGTFGVYEGEEEKNRSCAIEFRSDNKNVTLKGDIKFENNIILRRDDCTK